MLSILRFPPSQLAVPAPAPESFVLTMVRDHGNVADMDILKTVSISEFKATCLGLLEEVRQTGRAVLVTKRGVPIAQVVPPPAALAPGGWLGEGRASVRAIGDVLEPVVPPEAWEAVGV